MLTPEESIAACLARIPNYRGGLDACRYSPAKAGYTPKRRYETPSINRGCFINRSTRGRFFSVARGPVPRERCENCG